MNKVSMLIGGRDVGASNGAVYERLNPVTGELASRAPAATPGDADSAVDAAAAAFPAWAALKPSERRTRLLKAADLMNAR